MFSADSGTTHRVTFEYDESEHKPGQLLGNSWAMETNGHCGTATATTGRRDMGKRRQNSAMALSA